MTRQIAVPPPRVEDPPVQRSPLLRLYPALGTPGFRLLWLGMLPATLAWQMSTVTIGYVAFMLTGSATVLGLVTLATGLPMLLFSLIGGVVADRFRRRAILILTQCLLGTSSAALAALTFSGLLHVWHLVAFGFAQGIAFSFQGPARQAYIGELVGPRLLRNAIALHNAGMNFCRVAGPALAGILIAIPAIGPGGVFAGMATMYGAVLVTLFRLPNRALVASSASRQGGWAQLVEGLQYVRSSPALLMLLGMAFAPMFFGMPYQTLMPLFAERVFDVGPTGLGALMAATGLGALAGSLAVASLSGFSRPAALQLGFGFTFGLGLVGFGLAPTFPMAVAVLGLVGFASAAYMVQNNTLTMGNTDPQLYGRVMSINMLTFALSPMGSFPAAWLADQIGGPITIAGTGVLVLAAVLAAALYPPYHRIR
ncbi:MAG: MFS transporter [Chloroflexi bacterium]|nr:MFS transporter [Chloroflexota bacterium]